MATYISGVGQTAEVDESNEAAFEAAGWRREEDKPKKSEKDDK
jgi:hypothetical protein